MKKISVLITVAFLATLAMVVSTTTLSYAATLPGEVKTSSVYQVIPGKTHPKLLPVNITHAVEFDAEEGGIYVLYENTVSDIYRRELGTLKIIGKAVKVWRDGEVVKSFKFKVDVRKGVARWTVPIRLQKGDILQIKARKLKFRGFPTLQSAEKVTLTLGAMNFAPPTVRVVDINQGACSLISDRQRLVAHTETTGAPVGSRIYVSLFNERGDDVTGNRHFALASSKNDSPTASCSVSGANVVHVLVELTAAWTSDEVLASGPMSVDCRCAG